MQNLIARRRIRDSVRLSTNRREALGGVEHHLLQRQYFGGTGREGFSSLNQPDKFREVITPSLKFKDLKPSYGRTSDRRRFP